MKRQEIIAKLNDHRPELEAMGIDHLYLFGSHARNEATTTSDVDLLAEFNPKARVGFKIVSIKSRLEEILERPVDLLSSPLEKPRLKRVVDSEAVLAF